jgi:hypothetical protein
MPIDEGRHRSSDGSEGRGRGPPAPAPDPIRRAVHVALVVVLLPTWLLILLLYGVAIVALGAWGAAKFLARAILPGRRPGS